MGNDLCRKVRMASAPKPFPLAHAAQIDYCTNVKRVDQCQIFVGCLHVLARAKQHAAAHTSATRDGVSPIIAQIVNALGEEEGSVPQVAG